MNQTEDIEDYVRFCIFRRQSTIVAHALGFATRKKMFAHLNQCEPASYDDDDIEKTNEATGFEDSTECNREFLRHIMEGSGIEGKHKEIVKLMLDGATHKEIAERLNMSTQLLAYYKRRALQFMSAYAKRNGLVF
jgi:DNA-directed RNA polymerase specialized sigma subunit